jgi:hypothetical protein
MVSKSLKNAGMDSEQTATLALEGRVDARQFFAYRSGGFLHSPNATGGILFRRNCGQSFGDAQRRMRLGVHPLCVGQ